jgi:hypothetical protein
MKVTNDSLPQSQRVTVPTPMPFIGVADQVYPPRVGTYLIINERARAKRPRRRPVTSGS